MARMPWKWRCSTVPLICLDAIWRSLLCQRWRLCCLGRSRCAGALRTRAPVPVLILREREPPLTDVHGNGVTAQHILVPLDGSALAEAVLAPVASLRAALAT